MHFPCDPLPFARRPLEVRQAGNLRVASLKLLDKLLIPHVRFGKQVDGFAEKPGQNHRGDGRHSPLREVVGSGLPAERLHHDEAEVHDGSGCKRPAVGEGDEELRNRVNLSEGGVPIGESRPPNAYNRNCRKRPSASRADHGAVSPASARQSREKESRNGDERAGGDNREEICPRALPGRPAIQSEPRRDVQRQEHRRRGKVQRPFSFHCIIFSRFIASASPDSSLAASTTQTEDTGGL